MARARPAAAESSSPESYLRKATLAHTSGLRAKYALRGLERAKRSRTTKAMLLRQLYLSQMEGRKFDEALKTALDMVKIGVMPDVARQDAARACLGLGDEEAALSHLRLASRVSPPSRRAFHSWTLGTVFYLAGRHREAMGALSRAVRWGTTDRPLYQAQLVLCQVAHGEAVPLESVHSLRERLEESPCGQGYGQFVLGELALLEGDHDAARRYLRGFVKRSTTGRVALAVALSGEITRAKRLLKRMPRRKR